MRYSGPYVTQTEFHVKFCIPSPSFLALSPSPLPPPLRRVVACRRQLLCFPRLKSSLSFSLSIEADIVEQVNVMLTLSRSNLKSVHGSQFSAVTRCSAQMNKKVGPSFTLSCTVHRSLRLHRPVSLPRHEPPSDLGCTRLLHWPSWSSQRRSEDRKA